jgi:cytochrome c oxidase subunit 2
MPQRMRLEYLSGLVLGGDRGTFCRSEGFCVEQRLSGARMRDRPLLGIRAAVKPQAARGMGARSMTMWGTMTTAWIRLPAAVAGALAAMSGAAHAAPGQPVQGQIGFQDPVTPVAHAIHWLHNNWVNPIIIAIAAFVLILLLFVIFRFNERANPVPSKNAHNTALEVAWTVIPIFILIAIAIPSFKLLYFQYSFPKPDLTIKAVANAWFWEHEYPDEKIKVTSNMVTDEDVVKADIGEAEFNKRYSALQGIDRIKRIQDDAAPIWQGTKATPVALGTGRLVRQLSVDNDIAVPVNKTVHLLVTSNDVIHSWTIPSFGSKVQAVPGRITATWFKPEKIGVYYGQCSVLCGKAHSGMPIAIRVVSEKAYADWLAAVKSRNMRRAREILQTATAESEPRTLAELATVVQQ